MPELLFRAGLALRWIDTHATDEWTVVPEGGYGDDAETYPAGDFTCAGQG
jgi:hypothetical protein